MNDGRSSSRRATLKVMIGTLGILLGTNLWPVAVQADGPDDMPAGMLLSERFDDALLRYRGWYDGDKFNQYLLAPYFGPGLLPHEQTLWIDELAVSTERLGPLAKDSKAAQPQGAGQCSAARKALDGASLPLRRRTEVSTSG